MKYILKLLGMMLIIIVFFISCKADKTSSIITDIKSDKNKNYKVIFIELGSVKCIPCKMMQPIMKEIEKEYSDTVNVVFHDVWTPQGKPYALQYQIKSIPTQIFLDSNGEEYYRHEGFFPKEDLVKILESKL